MLADRSGYTVDFNVYTGKSTEKSEDGLTADVVLQLTAPFTGQGYQVFCDNYYTSVKLFEKLTKEGIAATGVMRVSRKGIPQCVKQLKSALCRSDVPRGVGYYIREPDSPHVFVCWRDNRTVLALSTAIPGHSESVVTQRMKNKDGTSQRQELPCPKVITTYNVYMGGVDKSDQFLAYHNVLRRTVCF